MPTKSTKYPPWRILIALTLVSLVVAGCGGDDSAEATSSTSSVATTSTAAPTPTEARQELKIAFVGTQRVTSGDWDPAGYEGFQRMEEILTEAGYDVTTSVAENADYDSAAQILRDYGNQGYDIVVPHSSGYEPAVLEVAPEYPNTWFLVFSDLSTTGGNPNVAGWAVAWSHLGYLQGAIACYASKTGVFGHVNSIPIPAFTKTGGGAKKAAGDICGSEDAYKTIWINSFIDVALAKDATLALVAEGADVIFDSADTAGQGVFEASKEADFWMVGKYVDQSALADQMITSVTINFVQAYEEMANLFVDGTLEAKVYPVNITNGGVGVVTPFDFPDPTVETRTLALIDQIKSGAVDVPLDLEVTP